MITLLSPSKGQDCASPASLASCSTPELLNHSQQLIAELRTYDSAALQKLMVVSPKIADLNVERYKDFSLPLSPVNSKQACAPSPAMSLGPWVSAIMVQKILPLPRTIFEFCSGFTGACAFGPYPALSFGDENQAG